MRRRLRGGRRLAWSAQFAIAGPLEGRAERAVSRVPLARRVHPRLRSRRLAIPSRPRGLLAVPPAIANGWPFSDPASRSRKTRLRSATRSEAGRRTTAARPSRQRGLRLGPEARGGRGRGAMRAVRRLVSSPPLPGPPRARAASRLASPGRRYAARPRAAPRPPSVPCGRPRRGAAPGCVCERAPCAAVRDRPEGASDEAQRAWARGEHGDGAAMRDAARWRCGPA